MLCIFNPKLKLINTNERTIKKNETIQKIILKSRYLFT